MALNIAFEYWIAIIAFDALLYPLLLFEIYNVHEFVANRGAVDTL